MAGATANRHPQFVMPAPIGVVSHAAVKQNPLTNELLKPGPGDVFQLGWFVRIGDPFLQMVTQQRRAAGLLCQVAERLEERADGKQIAGVVPQSQHHQVGRVEDQHVEAVRLDEPAQRVDVLGIVQLRQRERPQHVREVLKSTGFRSCDAARRLLDRGRAGLARHNADAYLLVCGEVIEETTSRGK